ncbi:MAG: M23 family metallopeptidase [Azospirillaceae bacterium]|nr:M23 family metallopeptidase [Azospirillaceae bacterium]
MLKTIQNYCTGIRRVGSLMLASILVCSVALPAEAGTGKPSFTVAPPSRSKPKAAHAGEAALAKPIRGARITSPYGWRIHPVLGVRKFHRGVDFAAPRGTPVTAAATGVVEDIGWHGHYGRYVRLRHSGHDETIYAHLQDFAHGLRRNSRVTKGETLGYVGTTGYATGPHLYFEVLIDHKQVDPLSAQALDIDQRNGHRSRLRVTRHGARADDSES